MAEDPRIAAARYRLERDDPDAAAEAAEGTPRTAPERGSTAAERAAYVETAIQQAIRRGDFDNLPGAGKPLEGLSDHHDPDWWIKRKIQTENLTGLGPPALTLRVESVALADRLDELPREEDVREAVDDFNGRVIEARRQLLGGPPVVTATRDVEHEVREWRQRREGRESAAAVQSEEPARRRRFRLLRWRPSGD